MRILRVGMAQINCTVGDLEGNVKKIKEYIKLARESEVDLVAFPELAVTGYPPEDLLLKPKFIEDNLEALQEIVQESTDICTIIGFVDKKDDIYNGAAIISNQKLFGVFHKKQLPNYGVFDEYRYFRPGEDLSVYLINGAVVGINICEDIWYADGPAHTQARKGRAEIIINVNASPYHIAKWKTREKMLSTRAFDNGIYVVYVNLIGGQDELVFDGDSMIFDPQGTLVARGKQFEEDFIIYDLELDKPLSAKLHYPRGREENPEEPEVKNHLNQILVSEISPAKNKKSLPKKEMISPHPEGEIYKALVLGTSDYLRKNGFAKAVIGLSGGIDSALVSIIAVDALGKENVIGVFMPSVYTAERSKKDAMKLASNLGIKVLTIPIQRVFQTYLSTLQKEFKGKPADVTEENLQARIRGNILMALSNKFGWIVLTTGNKSELACGYATLYGDMAGGFAVIKDIFKTLVYELAKYKNSTVGKEIIPKSIIEREPTAELREKQKDSDSLPPYNVLDPILKAYVEEDKSFQDIIAAGYEEKMVKRVISLVDKSEYKRRQAPLGIKVTQRAFGKDRRLPITNRYTGL